MHSEGGLTELEHNELLVSHSYVVKLCICPKIKKKGELLHASWSGNSSRARMSPAALGHLCGKKSDRLCLRKGLEDCSHVKSSKNIMTSANVYFPFALFDTRLSCVENLGALTVQVFFDMSIVKQPLSSGDILVKGIQKRVLQPLLRVLSVGHSEHDLFWLSNFLQRCFVLVLDHLQFLPMWGMPGMPWEVRFLIEGDTLFRRYRVTHDEENLGWVKFTIYIYMYTIYIILCIYIYVHIYPRDPKNYPKF